MEVKVQKGKASAARTEALVAMFFEGTQKPEGILKELDSALKGKIGALLKSGDAKGKSGEVSLIRTDGLIAAPRLFLIGLGKKEKLQQETLRQAAGTAAKILKKYRLGEGTLLIDSVPTQKFSPEALGEFVTEGVRLGAYAFERYKTVREEPKKELEKVTLLAERLSPARLERGVQIATTVTDSVCRVRDLISEPSNEVTPSKLASVAKEIGRKTGIKVTVLEKEAIQKFGMGGLLGVSRASH